LHGVDKFNKAPRDRKKNLIFLMTWRLHGVFMAMALLRSLHGVALRSYSVLIGDCLRSDRTSTAFFALQLHFHCAFLALTRRSHCSEIVLHIPAISHSE
jgi:hypothetical protein